MLAAAAVTVATGCSAGDSGPADAWVDPYADVTRPEYGSPCIILDVGCPPRPDAGDADADAKESGLGDSDAELDGEPLDAQNEDATDAPTVD